MELLITLITIVANLFLGSFVYLKNSRSDTNKYLAILAVVISLWTAANYFSLYSDTESATLFWIRVVMLFTSPLGPVLFLLVRAFPNQKIDLSPRLVGLIWGYVGVTGLFSLSNYMYTKVEFIDGKIVPSIGPAIALYAVGFLGGLILAFKTIIAKYRKARGVEKAQLKYLLLGIILTFTLAALSNFILVIVAKIINFVLYGPIFSLILIGFITYAVVKHRFLDISFVIARTISYSILVMFLAGLYASALFIIGNWVFPSSMSGDQFWISTILALILAYTFQPLKSYLERITDKIFFQGHYDTHDLLAKLSHLMSTTINLDHLINRTLQILLENVRVSSGGILLLNGSSPHKVLINYDSDFQPSRKQILTLATHRNKIIIRDEIPQSKIKTWMSDHQVSVVIPLATKENPLGVVILGNKSSGDMFSDQDIKVFQILAPELSIAIQNAKAFLEISRFNLKLKEEVRRKTAKLRTANKRLKLADKVKDEFLSIASHELRTPMTAIKSYLWMILNKSTGNDHFTSKTSHYLNRAYISTERLLSLVNDMLDVSRIEAGHIELHISQVSLIQLAKQVADELAPKSQERHLLVSVQEEPLDLVHGDQDKLHQVLLNLIGNAIKFTPPGGQVSVSFRQDSNYVYCVVEDTGKGIAQEDIPRLFTKFGRLDQSFVSVAESGGTGLGLFICNQIITRHGGKIFAESTLSKGSKFTFTLPRF